MEYGKRDSIQLTRRRLVALAGATGAIASGPVLAACAGEQATDGAPSANEPRVQLTYLHQWSPTQGHGPITDTLVARFKE